jgi:hypothetical protein
VLESKKQANEAQDDKGWVTAATSSYFLKGLLRQHTARTRIESVRFLLRVLGSGVLL